jgi:hypothetical protein
MKQVKMSHSAMSDVACSCGKLLKKNVVTRKPTARHCYSCGRSLEGHNGNPIRTAREVRVEFNTTGKLIGRKKGRYSPVTGGGGADG